MPTNNLVIAVGIETTADALVIQLEDRDAPVPWEQCSPRLAGATAEERQQARLSPGGYGIHWPLLDEDLSVAGLLRSGAAR
jgi:hypothetical protein